jgi:hypothetical protein
MVALLVLVSACSHKSAKESYISAAAKVCDASAHNIEVASVQLTGSAPTNQQTSYFLKNTLVPLYRTRLDQLRALSPPSADHGTINGILDDQARIVDAIEANPDQFATQENDPFAPIDTRWDAYGLKQCGSRT